MFLGALFVFLLSRTLAHPVSDSSPSENLAPPTSPVLNAFVAVSDCIRDSAKIRSKWELIWNCLGTIFVCTYIAIHHNMPDRNATKGRRMWQKVKTSLYALLAPEVIIAMAMRQRFAASRIAEQYRGHGWTMTHGFFLIMGGLMREDGDEFKVVTLDKDGNPELGGNTIEGGIVFPTISTDEIMDKAKGDLLSKVVVVMQTSWFVIQCVARHAQGLLITELELVTLAFATLNVITYFLWFSKPLNAEYPIFFRKDGSRSSGPMVLARDNLGVSDNYLGTWRGWTGGREESGHGIGWLFMALWNLLVARPFRAIFEPLDALAGTHGVKSPTHVGPYYSGNPSENALGGMAVMFTLIGGIFGGIHLIGWNFRFQTDIERDLWRISSVVITAEPVVLFCMIMVFGVVGNLKDPGTSTVAKVVSFVAVMLGLFLGFVLYIFARIALLVLPLFALRNLPLSAFETVQWADYIPHI
ncbi:hypothetical protein AX16_007385 [Volvariella volvacea WC 439]|nr:hypothetical protein AX16_007385 [Volvariella volvacea WC 439]